jgi:DNA-binding MarR family transcriptional regulator
MLSPQEYTALSEFRFQLARFLRFSEKASRDAGITPKQYLLLLHIRGAQEGELLTVGQLAARLQSSHHGTVALVNRCVASRLVVKRRSPADARRVLVDISPRGLKLAEKIAKRHRDELQALREVFRVAHVS